MYLCRSKSLNEYQEHLKCSTHSTDKDSCSAHYIRTVVLKELFLNVLNKLLYSVKDNEGDFVKSAIDSSASKHSSEVFKAKKALNQAEKCIAELDRLFARLYEDNVSNKISDDCFAVLSEVYENEQKKLKAKVTELTAFVETADQKSADMNSFIKVIQKHEHITELTPEIMHELIEKIVIHAPDKSSRHVLSRSRYTFALMLLSLLRLLTAENMTKRKRLRNCNVTQPIFKSHKLLYVRCTKSEEIFLKI